MELYGNRNIDSCTFNWFKLKLLKSIASLSVYIARVHRTALYVRYLCRSFLLLRILLVNVALSYEISMVHFSILPFALLMCMCALTMVGASRMFCARTPFHSISFAILGIWPSPAYRLLWWQIFSFLFCVNCTLIALWLVVWTIQPLCSCWVSWFWAVFTNGISARFNFV